jgi:glucokinase
MTTQAVVAMDIGGTTMKGALVGAGGVPLSRLVAPTPAAGGDAITDAVITFARNLADGLGVASRYGPVRVVAAAVVTPGQVDAEAGVIRYAANLGWRNVPLVKLLERELRVPVVVERPRRDGGAGIGLRRQPLCRPRHRHRGGARRRGSCESRGDLERRRVRTYADLSEW